MYLAVNLHEESGLGVGVLHCGGPAPVLVDGHVVRYVAVLAEGDLQQAADSRGIRLLG